MGAWYSTDGLIVNVVLGSEAWLEEASHRGWLGRAHFLFSFLDLSLLSQPHAMSPFSSSLSPCLGASHL